MAITPEEAQQELIRRGEASPEDFMEINQVRSREEQKRAAIEELKSRGFKYPGEEEHLLMSALNGAYKTTGDFSHGILQPLLESGFLGESIKEGSKRVANERRRDFERSEELNPKSTFAGSIAPDLVAGIGSAKVGATVIPRFIPMLGGTSYAKYLNMALSSGLAGGLTGAGNYTYDNESRLAKGLSGGAIGTALGAIPGLSKAGGKTIKNSWEFLKHLPRSFNKKDIAEQILNSRNKAIDTYTKLYGDFFKKAENLGIRKVKKPHLNADVILDNNPSKNTGALSKFLEDPTFENAHWAQSEMGKLSNNLLTNSRERGLTEKELEIFKAAVDAEKRIQGSMLQSISSKNANNLIPEYKSISEGYAKDVIPYKSNELIYKLRKGKLKPEQFVNDLSSDKEFEALLGEKHPEVYINKTLNETKPTLKDLAKIGVGFYAGHKLHQ